MVPSTHIIFAPVSPANEVTESEVVVASAPPGTVTMENCESWPPGEGKAGTSGEIVCWKLSDGMLHT